MILLKRPRYIIKRKDNGYVFCGLAKQFKFNPLDDIGDYSIEIYRSKSIALDYFNRNWHSDKPELEIVKINEILELEDK